MGLNRKTLSLAVGALVLVVVSRLPIAPTALSFDNVNFAFAIQQFDPWMHQPQPPGYPFFVAEARIVDLFFNDAEQTFRLIPIVVTWLSVVLAFFLGERMFGTKAGILGALLLVVNPTLWYSGLDSPLRPHLAMFSLLVGYCCWRLWNGEGRYALWAAFFLGVGGGFRPDLIVYLLPLWCCAMWKGRIQVQIWIRGIGIIFLSTMVWLGIAAYAVGGLDRYTLLMWVYSFSSMNQGSVLLRPSSFDWVYQVVRLLAWNGFGLLSWIWLVPFWIVGRRTLRMPGCAAFISAWIVPGMVIQALLHVDAPGHTLFSVPALCLMGGMVIADVSDRLKRFGPLPRFAPAGIVFALNVLFFFNVIRVTFSAPSFAGELGNVVTKAFIGGLSGTTFEDLRSTNLLSESTVRELKHLIQDVRPLVIVSTHGSAQYWRFLNARIASYYVTDREFWVVADELSPPTASRIRGKDLLEIRHGTRVKIPVPRGGRIIWLMDPSSPFREAVSQAVSLKQEGNIFLTDLSADLSQFRVQNFEFNVEQ